MKLRIGDKVRFLNEVGEGVVSQIKDKFTVYVEMNDGFEIPIASNQLVPIWVPGPGAYNTRQDALENHAPKFK